MHVMFHRESDISEVREEALTKVLHTVDVRVDRERVPASGPDAAAGAAVLPGPPVPDGVAGDSRGVPAGPPAAPALSISGAARRLGVATATLRSWERRYGLMPSLHTPGGHRRYGSEDLARLQVMHRLVRAGVPAAEAARVAVGTAFADLPHDSGPFAALLWADRSDPEQSQALADLADPVLGGLSADPSASVALAPGGPVAGGGLIEAPASLLGDPPRSASPEPDLDTVAGQPGLDAVAEQSPQEAADGRPAGRGSAGGGRVLPLPRHSAAAIRGLARAAMALDAGSCEQILDEALQERGTLATWDDVIRPVMAAIGRRWQATQSGVEIEHSFTMVVKAGLARRAVLVGRARNDSPVLLASVPEEMHDLPLRALHSALAEREIRSHLLGARTPHEALADAMRRLGPPVVVLWAQMSVGELPALPVMRPEPALIVGGPGLPELAQSRLRAQSLSEAIDQISAALGL